RIIERVERDPLWPSLMDAEHAGMDDVDADALVAAARKAAETASTACVVVLPTLGGTARRLARERPLPPVLALTHNPSTARRLALVWGLEPRLGREPASLEDVTDDALAGAEQYGLAEPGQRVLVLAGTPFGAPGAANLLRLAHVPPKSGRRRSPCSSTSAPSAAWVATGRHRCAGCCRRAVGWSTCSRAARGSAMR